MLTKISAPQILKGESALSSQFKNSIVDKIEKEKQLIDGVNANFNRKREEVLKTLDLQVVRNYLEKQRESYNSYFNHFEEKEDGSATARAALRKEIRKNALKKFPVLRELAILNSQNSVDLQNVLHTNNILGDYNKGLLTDPEILLPEEYDFDVFEPPYELLEEDNIWDGSNRFNIDKSLSWADWGTMTTEVRFNDSNGFFDLGSSYKYAWNNLALGFNYNMPRHGDLDVTVILTSLDDQINYSVKDNFGFSHASFDIENIIFIPVTADGVRQYLHSASMIDISGETDGDDISGTASPIAANARFILNFRTDHIHEGQAVQIMIASWFRIYSFLYNMDIDITASLLWKVDKVYVRVV
jgi:hypothetical protein